MDLSDLSDDNMRGYCHFPRRIYDVTGNFTLEPKINYETNLGFCYKQLANNISLNWFYPELIEIKKIQAQKKKEREERLRKTFENMNKRLNPLGLIGKRLDELTNPRWRKRLGIMNDSLGLMKPTQSILDQAIITSDKVKQNKRLFDQRAAIFNVHGTELEKIQSMLKGANNGRLGLSSSKKFEEVVNSAWWKQLAKNQIIIDQLNSRTYLTKIVEAQRINKLITPDYLESTKNALSAFNSNLSHRDLLKRVNQYTSLTDQVLNIGITVQIARDMLDPHRGVTDNLRLRLRDYERTEEDSEDTTELLREVIKRKDEQLESKDREISELKALLVISNKQDERIEKHTRENQLHSFIARVDSALTSNGTKPSAKDVLREIEKNHYEYDDEGIIQEVEHGVIQWRSKYGKEQTLSLTSFSATLSSIRKNN